MKKIRIALNDENCVTTHIADEKRGNTPDTVKIVETSTRATSVSALPTVTFSSEAADLNSELPSYTSGRFPYPAYRAAIDVPNDDLPIVNTWISGATGANPGAMSDTLRKRVTANILGGLTTFMGDASRRSLFTRPCRVIAAVRFQDGSIQSCDSPTLLSPSDCAPVIYASDLYLNGNTLQSVNEAGLYPVKLYARINPYIQESDATNPVTHILIGMTRQTDLYSDQHTVEGVRTVTIFGETARAWTYGHYNSDEVIANADADIRFRIIAEIPIARAVAGISKLRVPETLCDIDKFSELPLLDLGGEDPDNPDIPDDPDGNYRVRITTEPLDLGMPEECKRIGGVILRGIFSRTPGDVKMRLIALPHRDKGVCIATCRGYAMRLRRTAACRWWRVEIEATVRPGDKFEAVTFEVTNQRDGSGGRRL